MAKLGTTEWFKLHGDVLNADEEYRKYAKGLTSSFTYVMGENRTAAVFKAGEVVDVHAAAPGEETEYVLDAPLAVWKDLAAGTLSAKAALAGAKIKLTKGNMINLARYLPAAGLILADMAKVPTEE